MGENPHKRTRQRAKARRKHIQIKKGILRNRIQKSNFLPNNLPFKYILKRNHLQKSNKRTNKQLLKTIGNFPLRRSPKHKGDKARAIQQRRFRRLRNSTNRRKL